mgnify:CR=1 FL=1
MLNLRIIARALSGLILLEAALMALCYGLSFYYEENAIACGSFRSASALFRV